MRPGDISQMEAGPPKAFAPGRVAGTGPAVPGWAAGLPTGARPVSGGRPGARGPTPPAGRRPREQTYVWSSDVTVGTWLTGPGQWESTARAPSLLGLVNRFT